MAPNQYMHNIGSLNIRYLLNKSEEIKYYIDLLNPDILGISEAELYKNNLNLDELNVEGYNIEYTLTWEQYGYTRVVLYIKNHINYTVRSDLMTSDVQSIWLDVRINNRSKYTLSFHYRQHTNFLSNFERTADGQDTVETQLFFLKKFVNQWCKALETSTNKIPEVVVCGDMNINLKVCENPSYKFHRLYKFLEEFCEENNMTQMLNSNMVTRREFIIANGNPQPHVIETLVDHIYTNHPLKIDNVKTHPCSASDHEIVLCKRRSRYNVQKPKTVLKRCWKNFEINNFLYELSMINFNDIYESQDVNFCVNELSTRFEQLLNLHAPLKLIQCRKSYVPWLSEDTKRLFKQRDDMKNRANSSRSTSDITAFRQFRNYVNRCKNRNKKEYIKSKIENTRLSNDSNLMWKNIKSLLQMNQNYTPTQLKDKNGNLTGSAENMANILNDYFSDKVMKIKEKIDYSTQINLDALSDYGNPNANFQLNEVSEAVVLNYFNKLKDSRVFGIDKIDNNILKLSSIYLVKPTTHIINLSIKYSTYPDLWKWHMISPRFKKEDRLNKANYRPVTILASLSKILGKIIHDQLLDYFLQNNLLLDNHHGFIKNRSTISALTQLYEKIYEHIENSELVGLLMVDLSAAFDVLDHSILLRKLKLYGLSDSAISWFKSYLIGRKQCVSLEGKNSNWIDILLGVPQGSILGPILFLIYVNDMPICINDKRMMELFADDSTTISAQKYYEDLTISLNNNLNDIEVWCHQNRLSINLSKTIYMILGTWQLKRARIPENDNFVLKSIGGTEIERMESSKLLGLLIDEDITWKTHLYGNESEEGLIVKLKRKLNYIQRLKHYTSEETLKIFANGIFISTIQYAIQIWGSASTILINKIQRIQNSCARIILNESPYASIHFLLTKLNWLSIKQLHFYHSCILFQNIISQQKPDYLYRKIQFNETNVRYPIRHSNYGRVNPPRYLLSKSKQSFIFQSSNFYNELPEVVINSNRYSFKRNLKRYVMENIRI